MYKVEMTNKNKYELDLKRANIVVGSGGTVNPVWGAITGDITQQKDLMDLFKPMTDEECPLTLKLVINAGDSEANTQNVRIFLRTRGLPLYYKLSEDPDLNKIEWIPFDCNYVSFELLASKGEHTVYGQLKNQYKESEIVSEKITLI